MNKETTISYYNDQGCNYDNVTYDCQLTQNQAFNNIAERLEINVECLHLDNDGRVIGILSGLDVDPEFVTKDQKIKEFAIINNN